MWLQIGCDLYAFVYILGNNKLDSSSYQSHMIKAKRLLGTRIKVSVLVCFAIV